MQVGKYICERKLGSGAMGTVWLSYHTGLDMPVAVKILDPTLAEKDPDYSERFVKEGKLAASISHQNIIRVFDAGNDGATYYLVMEYIEGVDAKEMLEQRGEMSVDEVLELGISTAEALKSAHDKGVVHRDIKPENIMITMEGDIKLADLGIAKQLDDNGSTMTGIAMGTPFYIAPEQAMDASSVDHRCDIYSLGATLYHLATGTVPFNGSSTVDILMKHTDAPLQDPRKRRADLPENFCNVIMTMMSKDPRDRYKDCKQLITALNDVRYGKDIKAPTKKIKHFKAPTRLSRISSIGETEESENNTGQSKKIAALIFSIGFAVLIILAIVFKSGKDSQRDNAVTSNSNGTSSPTDPNMERENTIQQKENGDLVLAVADANAKGSLKIEDGKTKNWNSVNQTLTWKINLSKTGYFDVYATHMKELGESEIELGTPDSSFKGTITASDEAVVKLGNFEITNDNIFFITLKSITAGDVTSLKSVKLKYLGERKPNPFGYEPDTPFTSFEERSYPAGWQTTGSAFNPTPMNAGKMFSGWEINGAQGQSVVASINSELYSSLDEAAKAMGELTSPEFLLKHDYINMLISGGDNNTKVSITVDGYKVKSLDLPPPKEDTKELRNATMNVSNYVGKKVRLVFTDNSTKHFVVVDRITLTNKDNKEIKKIGGGGFKDKW